MKSKEQIAEDKNLTKDLVAKAKEHRARSTWHMNEALEMEQHAAELRSAWELGDVIKYCGNLAKFAG